jgi:hypothetical protein
MLVIAQGQGMPPQWQAYQPRLEKENALKNAMHAMKLCMHSFEETA